MRVTPLDPAIEGMRLAALERYATVDFGPETGFAEVAGIGIPAEKRAAVVEKFEQADSTTTRRFGGTGLGLAIVRELVTAMAGTVRIEDTRGGGTTFVVEVPLAPCASAVAPADSPPPAASKTSPAGLDTGSPGGGRSRESQARDQVAGAYGLRGASRLEEGSGKRTPIVALTTPSVDATAVVAADCSRRVSAQIGCPSPPVAARALLAVLPRVTHAARPQTPASPQKRAAPRPSAGVGPRSRGVPR